MTNEKANSILSMLLNSRETVLQALQRLGAFVWVHLNSRDAVYP